MKKSKKIIIGIIITLLAIWCAIFTTDYIRVSSFREPVFAVTTQTAVDGISDIYYGLGYKVTTVKWIVPEKGKVLISIEMSVFGKTIAAAIT
mgnify:CR=1 FL=1